MNWKQKMVNQYPNIIIADCDVTGIELEDDDIIVNFSEKGFFVKDNEGGKYYRTNGAQIVITGCDIENISIKEVRTQRMTEDKWFETMYDIEAKDFFRNINSGKWRLELVEEFYGSGRGFYTAQISMKDESFWCYIKMYFSKLVYCWNDVRYDWSY